MKRLLIATTLMMALVFFLSACSSYPEYERIKMDPIYGQTLNIDGVIYRQYPETIWRTDIYNQEKIKIGRIKYPEVTNAVYIYELDVDRIFIRIERERSFDANITRWLYRKDIDLPEFDAQSANCISFSRWENTSKTEPFNNTVKDEQVISEYFGALEKAGERPTGDRGPLGELYLHNSEHQGICVIMRAAAWNGKYWIYFDRSDTEFFEVSQELMEKLVGEKLPTAEEFIEQYNADRD